MVQTARRRRGGGARAKGGAKAGATSIRRIHNLPQFLGEFDVMCKMVTEINALLVRWPVLEQYVAEHLRGHTISGATRSRRAGSNQASTGGINAGGLNTPTG